MNAQQLKNSILQEAIEGRLVPQDPNDEPASVLLDKIRKEKARLVKEGKLKKKDLEDTPISKDEIPFKIPESWEWVRFTTITEQIVDCPHSTAPDEGLGFPLIRTTNVGFGKLLLDGVHRVSESIYNKRNVRAIPLPYDLIYAREATAGNVAVIEDGQKVCLGQRTVLVKPIRPYINSYWLAYFILSPYSYKSLVGESTGTTVAHVNLSDFRPFIIPLPPLAEQKRIVAKIEELLPKVEEYGKAQEALDKLNEELPERLKKSILQEAIEGRLVPQDPNDEPASVLLDKIRKKKARLVNEGKLKKKDLEETPISEDEKSFYIPKHWGLVRLGEITYNHGQKTPTEDFSYIDIGSIDNEHQKLNMTDNIIKAKDAPSRARKIVKRGDVLYATVRPYLHNLCIIDRDFDKEPIASTGFAVLSCINGVYNKFLFYYLLSPIFDAYANDGDNAKGMAYPAINDKKLYNGIVPLPPLAEQKRIVAKIEQLMKEIDKLKV